jgi:hypothetical protein
VRRLAVQERKDAYRTLKDYQVIQKRKSQAFGTFAGKSRLVVLRNDDLKKANNDFIGFGGFVRPSRATTLEIDLVLDDGTSVSKRCELSRSWNRIGVITSHKQCQSLKVFLRWPPDVSLSYWGLDARYVDLPEVVLSKTPTLKDMDQSQLIPETFYFPHDIAMAIDIDEDNSSPLASEEGANLAVKKCSYCGRLLPIDMKKLGSLSFHKHNAKRTNHQNECRVCKKWRINDTFNPLRTIDQLHESSVITRERKLFLREPDILQKIKDRTGAGLKSQIWKKFGKQCFACGKVLRLEEVQLDHTRPLAYLWPIDEHATCLCAEHNNQKKEKFPVDFYSEDQLWELAKITGLSYRELCKKEINQNELSRLLADLSTFAREWDPRTFAATARKIKEFRSEINLFEELRCSDETLYLELMERLKERPLSVEDIDG